MSTRLRKLERLTFVPGVPGTPAFAGGTYCPPPPRRAGATYQDCKLLAPDAVHDAFVRRGLPEDLATTIAFGGGAGRPPLHNFVWLPGCVYADHSAIGMTCRDFIAPTMGGSRALDRGVGPLEVTACRSFSAPPRYFRALDEFGRRASVVPAPSPIPSRRTFIPTFPPPPIVPVVAPAGATLTADGCFLFSPRPGAPATRDSVRVENRQEWDAGAHSQVSHPRDCRLTFTATNAIGAVCGFTPARTPADTAVDRIDHGFILSLNNGAPAVRVIERGQIMTGFSPVVVGETLQITRRAAQVFYDVASAGQVYASTRLSTGAVKVAASLFNVGDYIG